MTPERQKWWANLPQREKMLREQILETKGRISKSKFALRLGRLTDGDKEWVISRIKKKKAVLTALKHELDNKAVATYTGRYGCHEGPLPICRCKNAAVRSKILGRRTAAGAVERLWGVSNE